MSLIRYLGEGKIEILYWEFESLRDIKLKTAPSQLISESRLEKRLESSTIGKSAIFITVGTSKKVAKLCSKRLRFEGALKVVEKYQEARSSLVYLSCVRVGHDYLGECKDRTIQCVIAIDAHKVKEHRCGVIGCTIKIRKIALILYLNMHIVRQNTLLPDFHVRLE